MDLSALPDPIRRRFSGSVKSSVSGLNEIGEDADRAGAKRSWRFLCLAEIANFPALRRLLGRARADRLVVDVATRIGQILPDARLAIVGRALVEIAFEGSERGDVQSALSVLAGAFETPARFKRKQYTFQMIFGIAAADAFGCDEVCLVEEAEEGLARAREAHFARADDPTWIAPTGGQLKLTAELPVAIDGGQLFLQFQPKLNLRHREIVGVEALVRWDHPVRGLIVPADFIASAEASRHIASLTIWTLRQAIDDQNRLAGRGYDVPIFLNISGHLLGNEAFVATARRLILEGNAKIGFEITETAVIRDPDAAITNLQRFADIGVPIAIDDYGAGLSSLSYLKRLPAKELKIDKLFITNLTSSNRDPLIVRSTIDLAHALEMEVTAEGVENPSTLALLSVMGCDAAQGFLISKPIGLGALLQYLDEGRHLEVATDPRANPGGLVAVWQRA